ncbi:MAG: response regulator [Planctomycetes bacterium]|nr:response regulator [Planctomycetota bacterium]
MAYVLIVDDDLDFANTTAVALRGAGHEVNMESNVDGALENMNRRRPDLLILDVMFSEDISAGFVLARAMRHHHEHLKGVPILMLTAVNTRFPLGFGRRDIDDEWLPVSDFLEKPVELKHLVRRVEELLGSRSSAPEEENETDATA